MNALKRQEEHMYNSLLVPLDGSTFGEHALPVAVSLARRLGAALHVVLVHVPIGGVFGETGFHFDAMLYDAMREQDRAYLDTVVERLSKVADISPRSALLDGLVPSQIIEYASANGVNLMIMTSHGRGPLARFWLGSVADALVRQSSVPILVVRPQDGEADLTREPLIEHIHIPLDGSELAEQIIEPAVALAAAMQAEITLLRIVQQWAPTGNGSDSGKVSWIRPSMHMRLKELDFQVWTQAKGYLDQLAEQLRSRSMRVQTRVISQVPPVAGILDDAAAHGADLIALATNGRGGFKRLLVGSVADKVLRGATTAVLVQRPVGEFVSAAD
jgi:nucleotide-binding universal stress UspA family protein